MKKKFIVGSLGCIVAGLLIFLISMAFLGFDFEKLSITPGESEEKNVTLDSLNKNIMIHEQNADISIGISTDDMIHIHYTNDQWHYRHRQFHFRRNFNPHYKRGNYHC